ncbi:MAG: RHH-type rel operon transcriptional repressor/antitoxin RelB [Granulosicoccus sp.]|jgi:RHH-type rel operon transcriptional repressor/antitoxin RelB
MVSNPFSIRIDDEFRDKLEQICALTERSKAYITNKAIEEHVERNGWKVEALKQAKKEAVKGEFISHEAMGNWITSLGTENELPAPEVDILKTQYEESSLAEIRQAGSN